MAPIKCILHQMKNEQIKRKAMYFFGANALKDLFMSEQMRQFEEDLPDFTYVPALAKPEEGDDWDGETGLVTEVVKRNVKNAEGSEAYLCGSPGMIDAAIKVLNELGVTEDRIFYDKFA
jgi:Na+-transporting NADH:ubiquinone oxidoreductase subunit F